MSGKVGRPWTDHDVAVLRQMKAAKKTYAQIGKTLNRHPNGVQSKWHALVLAEQGHVLGQGMHIPRHVLDERDARLAASPRDLSGSLLGDPPRGFSALERR